MATSARARLDVLFKDQPRPMPSAEAESKSEGLDLEVKFTGSQDGDETTNAAQTPGKINYVQQMSTSSSGQFQSSEVGGGCQAAHNAPIRGVASSSTKVQDDEIEYDVEDDHKDTITQIHHSVEFIPYGKTKNNVPDDELDEIDGAGAIGHYSLPAEDKHGNKAVAHYCIFSLVAKFPYKYLKDPNDRVSRQFFASNKFYERAWDLYYLHPPSSSYAKEIILVPHSQVQTLIDDINSGLNLDLIVPPPPFTVSFFQDGTPHPLLLGRSTSREIATNLQNCVPAAMDDYGECPEGATPQLQDSFQAFAEKCKESSYATKKSKSGKKKKRAGDRFLAASNFSSQLRRLQRYLGLRPLYVPPPVADPQLSWSEQQEFYNDPHKATRADLDPLDVSTPSPYPFDQEPIVIAFDVEAYERAHHIITEVGVSTLDTLDLKGNAPGADGQNWMKQIRSRHFRIKGREHLVNREFCPGDPEGFQFGESEILDVLEVRDAVDSCFEWPFSITYKHDGTMKTWDDHAGKYLQPQDQTAKQETQQGAKERNIVIVGHDIGQDLAFLENLGSKIFSAQRNTYPVASVETHSRNEHFAKIQSSIVESLDTAQLYRALKQEEQTRGLTSVLIDLGLDPQNMHNAGNDARYTLMALVSLAVKARQQDGAQVAKETDLRTCHETSHETTDGTTLAERQAVNQTSPLASGWHDVDDTAFDTNLATDPDPENCGLSLSPDSARGSVDEFGNSVLDRDWSDEADDSWRAQGSAEMDDDEEWVL